MSEKSILSLKNISKSYPGVQALDDVSVEFKKGEVHAIVGENGAGKSTLIKVISGAITADSGEIIFEDKTYSSMTPHHSSLLGIDVIYQEFNLVSSLSVAENVFLGNQVKRGIVVNFKEIQKRTKEILDSFHIDIDPTSKVKGLSVAYMQIVEIAKALSKDVKLLIMDEPTAPLTNVEVDMLFKLIKSLKEKGVTILYISHRLEEIFEISDRVTVMRDGKKIITMNTADTNRKEIINHMVGKELKEKFSERNKDIGETLLEVKNLCGNGLKDISFEVKKGEIFGIAGLVGAKRTELVRMIFGADSVESGEIFFEGKKTKIRSPRDAISAGIGLVPEDRKYQGAILKLSIRWNITLPIIKSLSRFSVISTKKESKSIERYIRALSVKLSSPNQKVATLSGGNQQKIVLSKWLASESKLLIFDEPTRGIDVGAKQEIYALINSLAETGISIILISSELEEVIGLADRLIVLAEGEMVKRMEKPEYTKKKILNYASGNK